jgi:hypothetical protein
VKFLFPITYFFGSLALCVILASALVGVALTAGRRRLARLEPSAQSRIALAAAVEFGSGDLEARVRELLDSRQRRGRRPSAAPLIGCSAALCLLALFAAHGLHYLGQAMLRLP